MTTDADPTTPRYVLTGGGTPTPEQLAALAVALTPVAPPEAPEPDQPAADESSAWARAARLEGVGHRTFVARSDVAAGRFPLG